MPELRNPIRILLVDDESEQTESLQEALENYPDADFKVAPFNSGYEAIKAVAEHPSQFDVALVDMDLGDNEPNGIVVMQQLFQSNRWLPVILFTGQDSVSEMFEGIEEGAYFYHNLRKGPTSSREIGAHCVQAVKNRALLRSREIEKVSRALLSTRNLEEVWDTYETELYRLGYASGAIYSYGPGWLVGEEAMPGVRNAISHNFLYQVRKFGTPELPDYYDLDESTRMNGVLEQDPAVIPLQDHVLGDTTYLVIPIRDKVTNDRKLGAVILGPRVDPLLEEEADALGQLGHQMALAVRNALDFHLQYYSTKVWNEILDMNTRIGRLLEQGGTTSKVMSDVMDEVAAAISGSLGFRRVLISVVSHDKAELCGIFGLSQEEVQKHRGKKTPLCELQKLDQEIYRHGSSYFIPAGCIDLEQYNLRVIKPPVQSDNEPPWWWHSGDQLRTRVKNGQDNVVAYIAMDEQNDTRPAEGTFNALEIFAVRLADLLENIEVRRHRAEMEVIKNVGDQLNIIRDLKELYRTVHQQLSLLMYAEKIKIGIYDAAASVIKFPYLKGESKKLESIPIGQGLMSHIIGFPKGTEPESLWLPTSKAISDKHKELGLSMLGDQACSWVGTFLRAENQVLGAIALEHDTEEYAYDEHDLKVLEIVSTSVANALYRIALEDDRDKRVMAALRAVSTELVGGVVSRQQVEQRILQSAAHLTNADYGVFLHYKKEHEWLVARPGDWYVRDKSLGEAPTEDVYLPLKPTKDQPGSLAILAVLQQDVQKWDEVDKEKHYIPTIPGMHSLIAMPVFVSDRQSGERTLYGVWTMEARQPSAFTEAHVDILRVFSDFAVQSVQRAQKQQEARSLLAWTLLTRHATLVRHVVPNLIEGVQKTIQVVDDDIEQWGKEIYQLGEVAQTHINPKRYRVENVEKVGVNNSVVNAIAAYRSLAPAEAICIRDPQLYLPDDATVFGSQWGLQEVLLILFANAYGKLLESHRNRYIQVTTDRAQDGGTVLRIFNSGPPLNDEVTAYLNGPNTWDPRYRGLSQVRLLLGLYRATLRVSKDDDEGVEFEIYWPPRARRPRNLQVPSPEQQKHVAEIRQQIAERQAYRFTHEVAKRCHEWHSQQQLLTSYITAIQGDVERLDSNVRPDIDQCTQVGIHEFLYTFAQDLERWDTNKGIDIRYDPSDLERLTDIKVWVNTTALRLVLHDLVNNAVSAIRAADCGEADGSSKPAIAIEVEPQTEEFIIRVRNTGSTVPAEIWELLTRQPIYHEENGNSSGHGMGLFLSNELVRKCGGSLSPTENNPETGVVFTIRLRYSPNPKRGDDHVKR